VAGPAVSLAASTRSRTYSTFLLGRHGREGGSSVSHSTASASAVSTSQTWRPGAGHGQRQRRPQFSAAHLSALQTVAEEGEEAAVDMPIASATASNTSALQNIGNCMFGSASSLAQGSIIRREMSRLPDMQASAAETWPMAHVPTVALPTSLDLYLKHTESLHAVLGPTLTAERTEVSANGHSGQAASATCAPLAAMDIAASSIFGEVLMGGGCKAPNGLHRQSWSIMDAGGWDEALQDVSELASTVSRIGAPLLPAHETAGACQWPSIPVSVKIL
jgi:hypothetical protein